MLKFLIVDDEAIIRNGIALKIERLIPHAVIVGKAESAEQAMEFIDAAHPDIVITDIRMPGIDGLQFIEQVKSRYSDIKFIIISGHQDFEYAKKAIVLGVEDYLLKPVKNHELKDIIDSLEKKLKKESSQKAYLNELKFKAESNTVFLRNKFLTDAVNYAGELELNQISKALSLLSVAFTRKQFTVAVLLLDDMASIPDFSAREDIPLVKFAVMNIAEEILLPLGTVVAFENLKKENQIVLVINHTDIDEKYMFRHFEQLLEALRKVLKVTVSIGIGKSREGLSTLSESYQEAYSAAIQKVVLGPNCVVHIDFVPNSNLITFFIPENEKQQLYSFIGSRNVEKAFAAIDSVFETIKAQNISYSNVKTLCLEILIMLGRLLKESGGSIENIFQEDIFSEEYLSRCNTLDELNSLLKSCISNVSEYLADLKKSDGKKIIREIKTHIDNYYYTNINLNDLAGKYFINLSYLSQLFKNETGEKFVDYLTRVRVEKAKSLLSSTMMKSYEVAEMVGYSDPRYFSDVFLKVTGTSPTKYRECAQVEK